MLTRKYRVFVIPHGLAYDDGKDTGSRFTNAKPANEEARRWSDHHREATVLVERVTFNSTAGERMSVWRAGLRQTAGRRELQQDRQQQRELRAAAAAALVRVAPPAPVSRFFTDPWTGRTLEVVFEGGELEALRRG